MDVTIATSLVIFPLLPAGLTYLGVEWPWALEVYFLCLAGAGLAIAGLRRAVAGRAIGRPERGESMRLVGRGYATWLIPAVAAMLLGLLATLPLDGVLLGIEAGDLAGRLFRPMDQAADPAYSLRVGMTYLEGGLAFWLLSAALTRARQPARRIRLAITSCLAAVVIVSIVAIVQYVTRANLLEYWVRANPDLTRSHATLDDPNALASFLVLGIGLAIGVAWSAGRGTAGMWRAGAMLAAALGCGALVTTVSRAGWAALVLAALVAAIRVPDWLFDVASRGRLVRRGARTAIAVTIAALAIWTVALAVTPKRAKTALPETPWQAFVQTADPRESFDAVLKGRLLLWRAAVRLARDNWALGAGLGQFPRFYATYPGSAGPENAHNYFLQVLAEGGVVGLAGLSALLATIAWAIGRPSRERGPGRSRLAVGLSVGVLAFVLTWLTGHPLFTLSNQLWLASVLAVGLAALDRIDVLAPDEIVA